MQFLYRYEQKKYKLDKIFIIKERKINIWYRRVFTNKTSGNYLKNWKKIIKLWWHSMDERIYYFIDTIDNYWHLSHWLFVTLTHFDIMQHWHFRSSLWHRGPGFNNRWNFGHFVTLTFDILTLGKIDILSHWNLDRLMFCR